MDLEEELQEPFGYEEETQIVLFRDLRTFGFDILEQ